MELKWKNLFKRRFKEQDVKEVIQKEKSQYYDIGPIDATNAVYRMIIGQRSNGKTYSVCRHMVEDYFKKGNRSAYIRRWDEDIQPKHIGSLFNPHIPLIMELSEGKYNMANIMVFIIEQRNSTSAFMTKMVRYRIKTPKLSV